MIDYRSIREWVDQKLAEAGHVPANTSGAPAIPADLVAAAQDVARDRRLPERVHHLARAVLALAGQDGEAA